MQQLHTSKTLATDKEALTHVTKDNFTDYFLLNGSATDNYNQTTGVVTITPDENNKVGNFSLKSKIDMNTSFTLTGQINLGSRTSSQGGADGISFAFHTGNTTDIGNAGGNLGIGGLQNAIGFKLDTYHNGYQTPQANKDGAQVASNDSNGYGYDTDPDGTQNPQFGAFVNTSQKLVQAQDGNSYLRWWATTDMSSVKKLNSGDLDGQFHNFVVSYDGSSRKLTIKYTETGGNVLTWSTSIPDANQAMAMVVSASTGGSKNLQQFEISSFDFKQAATVNVKYVDQKGNQLAHGTVSYPSGADVNGTYDTTSLNIPKYTFIKMSDSDITGGTSLPASGTLENPGDNGTVIYVYAPAYTATTKKVNETINHVNQNGETVSASYTATPINFLTVTNPVDGSSVTYYSIDNTDSTLDKETGFPTNSKWKQASSTDFQKVVNPEVKGYTVTSNNAPNSDLTSVATQTVYNNSSDLNFTVVYTKDAPTITTEKKTVNETVSYVDQNGQALAQPHTASVDFTRQVSTDAVTGEKTYGPWSADQSFDAVTSPELKGYTADKAQIDKQTVNGDSKDLEFTVTYTKNAPTITTEKKTVNETVSYVDQNGQALAQPHTASVDFTRQVSTDAVTGEKTYGPWSADQSFDAVTSPELKGYTADKAQIDKQTVNGDSKDLEFTVTYTKNAPTITTEKKTVNETVSYVDQNGQALAQPHTASVDFTRQVSTDAVTGEKTYGPWSADQSFDAVTSPELKGYTADKAQTAAVTDLNADSADVDETVTYTKVGSLVLSSSDGNFPGAPTVVYPNDPSDATKVTPASVPTVPGYTAHDPEGHVLTPGSSYQPSDPTKDTTITYTADKQKGSVSYVDDTTGNTLKTDSISGTTGSKSSYSTSGSIADYKKQGYELVTDGYPADLTFDNDDTTDQNFTVHLKHQLTPVNPTDPQTPGAPINPDEPDGPKWPTSTNYDKTVNETVSYVDQNGHVVAKQHTDSVNFTRTVVVDNVTGKVITSGAGTTAWTATNGDTTFDAVVSPVVTGSVADKAQTAAVTDLNADSADVDETVTYTKVGSLVLSSSDGNFPGAPTVVYPNDPSDATKVTPASVPTVPGYTAHDPEGHVLTPGSSYQPSDPTKDTTITYTADKQKGSVSYVDDTTGNTLKTDSISGTTGSKSSYSTSGSIADYKKQGYELVTDGYPADLTFDNDDTTDQNFTVHLKHQNIQSTEAKTVTETIHYQGAGNQTPADNTAQVTFTRQVSTDTVTGEKTYGSWSADQSFAAVTSPVIKGYTPDQAEIGAQTVSGDASDLDFTVIYTKDAPTITTEKKTVNETVSYVDQNGHVVAKPHTDSVDFTRQVSTDAVTGEKTYGHWSADQSFAPVTSPELKGYTADKAQIDKQTVNGDSKDLEFTVTYTKTPVAGGNVTAKYVDENGNPIADDVIASGNVGDPYSTTQKDVPGYTFKEVQGNPTGSFTDQDQTVTYVYTKNPATDNNGGTGLNQPGKPGNGTDTGNPSSNQPGNPSQPSNATNNGVINTSTNTGSKVNNGAVNSPELPQTGENNSQSQTMSFIGILLAMFGSLLGFLGIKKRRND
ncbi:putative internalin [Lactiplantibacillus plantarum]|nr:putative internalin [Lactiplantibacillus plantarum]